MNPFQKSATRATPLTLVQVADLLTDAGVRNVTHVTRRPDYWADRSGIDYIAHRHGGRRPLFVDLKEFAYTLPHQNPHVLLETATRGRATTPGWANDPKKQTDVYLLVFGNRRPLVLSARQVRAALAKYVATWRKDFRTGQTVTQGYYEEFVSEYLLVPLDVLTAACEEATRSWRRYLVPPPRPRRP